MEEASNNNPPHRFDRIQDELLFRIGSAKRTLLIAVTWFTDHMLFDALLDQIAAVPDLQVHLIVLNDKINNRPDKGIKFQRLIQPSRGFFYYSSGKSLVHHKFCIIDGQTVITGSYNWTNNARGNRENIFIIEDENVASEYAKEFTRITEGQLVHDVEASKRMDEPFNADRFFEDDDHALAITKQNQRRFVPTQSEGANWNLSSIKHTIKNRTTENTQPRAQTADGLYPFDLGLWTTEGFHQTVSLGPEPVLDFEGEFWIHWQDPKGCGITIQRKNAHGIKDVEFIDLLPTKPVLNARNDFKVIMKVDNEQGKINTIVERTNSGERARYRSWKINDYATR